ncbi:MAG: phosphoesterase, partial [Armatimonadota bacterium]|nr:phosphoesterase [Armatimonadota bacterium]
AGVVWQRCLERLGYHEPARAVPDRIRNAWTDENRLRVDRLKPARLFVMDLGSNPEPVLPGVPTCFIDHHRPGGVGEGDTLISAYTWNPIPNTSMILWDLCSPLADISDLDWVAAIGAISDLGDNAPFDLVRAAKRKYTAKYLKEVTTLINAARRSSLYDPEAAARALLNHSSPRELFDSSSADVEVLREARVEVKAALEVAKKAAPAFAGKVALVRLHSRCQVHPLIAQIWRTRLPKFIVIAANDEYVPGRVNFSARSARGESVLDFLRSIPLSEGEGSYANGHDQASGGSLPVDRWNELLAAMGFTEEVFVGR